MLLVEKAFGKSWQTTVGAIMTAIFFVPVAIDQLNLVDTPEWLRITGVACSFISFIYTGVMTKSKTVTGVGTQTTTLIEMKKGEDNRNTPL